MAGPLAGVRVLDLCHFLAGPYATLVLADLGADVVKLEDPDHPDDARAIGPYFQDGQSLYFASLNWGKRSLGVRLTRPEGRKVALELVRETDVVVDNFRPGVTAKLGLEHETLVRVNPRIVTCSLTGFGETGPYAERPGYDYTIQALSGVMSMTGEPEGPPGKAGISYVDHGGGLAVALGICAALIERDRTGAGRHLDIGLLDVQISMLSYVASWHLNAGHSPARTGNAAHPSLVPAQNFRARDGDISVFVGHDAMWARLVAAVGDERLRDPAFATAAERAAQRDRLLAVLDDVFSREGRAYWVRVLSAAAVPCSPVNDLAETFADEHVAARGLVATASHDTYGSYRHTRGPIPAAASDAAVRAAPLLGEQTRELLRDLGYDAERIDRLVADGVAVEGAS